MSIVSHDRLLSFPRVAKLSGWTRDTWTGGHNTNTRETHRETHNEQENHTVWAHSRLEHRWHSHALSIAGSPTKSTYEFFAPSAGRPASVNAAQIVRWTVDEITDQAVNYSKQNITEARVSS